MSGEQQKRVPMDKSAADRIQAGKDPEFAQRALAAAEKNATQQQKK